MDKLLNNEINIEKNIELIENQNSFLQSTLGKTINTGIDIGIRALLPDYLEDQIINLKNNLMDYGLKDGIKKTISDTIGIGKSMIGIVTGKFENINQVQQAVEKGGLIDNISSLLNDVIDKVYEKGMIGYNTSNILKQGKNSILKNVEKNIENNFNNQVKTLNFTEKYINNWKEYFNKQDFDGMEREYKKIEQQINNLIPIENTINQVRTIENLHALIKNNGKDFNLTHEELELAEKLR